VVESVCWRYLKSNSLGFIDWYIESLCVLIKVSFIISLLVNERSLLWWSSMDNLLGVIGLGMGLDEGNSFIMFLMVVSLKFSLTVERKSISFRC